MLHFHEVLIVFSVFQVKDFRSVSIVSTLHLIYSNIIFFLNICINNTLIEHDLNKFLN